MFIWLCCGEEGRDHAPNCPCGEGRVIWKCSCEGQYCEQDCDGQWISVDGSQLSKEDCDMLAYGLKKAQNLGVTKILSSNL